jgi:hypothetical protein
MKLDFNQTLGAEQRNIRKGQKEFESVMGTPSPIPPDIQEASQPSRTGETKQDLQEGVGAFTHGIDTIVSALFLVIGKFEMLGRLNILGVFFGLVVALVMTLALFRLESLIDGATNDRTEMRALKDELVSIKNDIQAAKVSGTQTQQAIEVVKKAAEEEAKKPDISIVTDRVTGQARVVIQPKAAPESPSEPELASEPAYSVEAAPTSGRGEGFGGGSPPAASPKKARAKAMAPAAIELPIQLPKGARVVDQAEDRL